MARKRFHRIKHALRLLSTPTDYNSDDGGTPQAPPAGTILAKASEVISGARKVSYTREASSKPGSLTAVQGKPFYDLNASSAIIVQVSARSWASSNAVAQAAKALCNIAVKSDGSPQPEGFTPAKAIVQDYGTAYTEETSKITGIKYPKRSGTETFTFPVMSNGTKNWKTVKGEIEGAVDAQDTANVTFKPEMLV